LYFPFPFDHACHFFALIRIDCRRRLHEAGAATIRRLFFFYTTMRERSHATRLSCACVSRRCNVVASVVQGFCVTTITNPLFGIAGSRRMASEDFTRGVAAASRRRARRLP
jgi:hypothetical protein